MKCNWIIKDGRVIDPASGEDCVRDLYIKNGFFSPVPPEGDYRTVKAKGLLVCPGLTDLHVHFREPGNIEAETIRSGSLAAAKGGFTNVVTMPNTNPPPDSPEGIRFQISTAAATGLVSLMPSGCITVKRQGREIADIEGMAKAGAIAFTDDGSTVSNDVVMKGAMERAKKLGTVIMDHALDPVLASKGVMRKGARAEQLGLAGIPEDAEINIVRRDIELSRQTGCKMHIQHISSERSVLLVRDALSQGIPISAEATPHHIALADTDVDPGNTSYKVNPPLGTKDDIDGIIQGLCDGTIKAFATDHAPHRRKDKEIEFPKAAFGAIGLETAIGVTYKIMVNSGRMSIGNWLARWTTGPCSILGIPFSGFSAAAPADICLIDISSVWTVKAIEFLSQSRNCPFEGWNLPARAVLTMKSGRLTWCATQEMLTD
jgi:dihydroorotase